MKIVTIGVYGFTEESFFQALQAAGVDTFCDIRQRRGVRGAAYAFANSQRLQRRLAEMGIRYLYHQDLAPGKVVRARQVEADKVQKVAKRQRTVLGEAFVMAYRSEILANFDPKSLFDEAGPDTQVLALCCVEREPAACHRSLVADQLRWDLGLEVEHLRP
jgi:uncharacterized protein (DUF488 family)